MKHAPHEARERDREDTSGGSRGPWLDALGRVRKNRLALFGATAVGVIAAACFLGPLLFALDPMSTHPAEKYLAPSLRHLLGTDTLGRDYLARVLVGGQTSLLIGFAAALASVVVGVLYGA
ncbi:MAG TPA: hypothetical protein VF395_11140, partial [Polyangiaceae bacterium]